MQNLKQTGDLITAPFKVGGKLSPSEYASASKDDVSGRISLPTSFEDIPDGVVVKLEGPIFDIVYYKKIQGRAHYALPNNLHVSWKPLTSVEEPERLGTLVSRIVPQEELPEALRDVEGRNSWEGFIVSWMSGSQYAFKPIRMCSNKSSQKEVSSIRRQAQALIDWIDAGRPSA